jgi:SAM-dependent MidA family methyltransferase
MTPLEAELRGEITQHGPIPFQRFMERALYHPEHGYYRGAKDPFGKAGDFFTNSQLQPVFGRLLARQLSCWREEMSSPADFAIIEIGAGRAETLQEVQRSLPGVRCEAIDIGSGSLPDHLSGVVYANEFFDALPVHVVEQRPEGLVELFVDYDDRGGFHWGPPRPAGVALEDYVRNYTPGLELGQRLEVNLAALDHLESIARSLKCGYVLTIDYGYTASEIAAGRRFASGSLMSYARHQAFEDVFSDPGGRDITAHVNFTALEQRGKQLGLTPVSLQTQAQFLLQAGEPDQFQGALAARDDAAAQRLRMQLKTLLFGMGETFRVLVQRKESYTPSKQ